MYRLLGSSYGASGHNKDSKEMYQVGLVLAEKVGDASLVYKFINRLATEAYMESDYKGAIPIAEHALEIARQLEDKVKIVQSLNDLGNLHYAIKEYPRAKQLLTEALSYLPDIKNQVIDHTILNTLGRVLTANREYSSAAQVFVRGLGLIEDMKESPWVVGILASISELLNGMKEKPLALALVALLVDHPMSAMDVKARMIRLHAALLAEKIQPENREWGLNQISRIVGDLIFILKKE